MAIHESKSGKLIAEDVPLGTRRALKAEAGLRGISMQAMAGIALSEWVEEHARVAA